jgi:hypothetical protein
VLALGGTIASAMAVVRGTRRRPAARTPAH